MGSGVTVALFEAADYSDADIAAYQACFHTHASVTRVIVNGFSQPLVGSGTTEATLDIETIIGLAPKAKILADQAPNTAPPNATYAQIASDNSAQVVSTSWGQCEAAAISQNIVNAEDNAFMTMAMEGQSIFAASGDSGSEDCATADKLTVDDPASQPYVTGVGGTDLQAPSPGNEVVWNSRLNTQKGTKAGAGGGGVSKLWPMPSWQAPLGVNGLSSGQPCGQPSGYCREVPDVTAMASPGLVIYCSAGDCEGSPLWQSVGGTSLAAPTWGAVAALTDASIHAQHRIGFADPALYEIDAADPSAFNDITAGNNDLSGNNGGDFPAAPGYDMASGLGSPYGAELIPELADTGVQLLPTIAAQGAPFAAGHKASWTVQVTNSGTVASTGTITVSTSVIDSYGGGYYVAVTGAGSGWTCSSGSCSTGSGLAPGSSLPVLTLTSASVLSASNASSGGLLATATIDDTSNGGVDANSSATASTPVVFAAAPHLQPVIAAQGAPFAAGHKASWTVQVTNSGTVASTGTITVSTSVIDSYGGGYYVAVTGAGSGWTCSSGSCSTGSGLAPGSSLPVLMLTSASVLSASNASSGGLLATATIDDTSNGGVDANSSATASTPVVFAAAPHLQPVIAAQGAPFAAGHKASWTVQVTNSGTVASTGTITVSTSVIDSYGGGYYVAVTGAGSGWTCSSGSCSTGSGLAPGSSLPVLTLTSASVLSASNASSGGLLATATIDDTSNGGVDANSSATASTPVVFAAAPHLQPVIAAQGAPFAAGHKASWTVQVTNSGTRATKGTVAVGIGVDDASLGNIGWTATGTGWTCSQSQCTTKAIVPAAHTLPALTVAAPLSSAAGGEVTLQATINDIPNGGVDSASTDDQESPVIPSKISGVNLVPVLTGPGSPVAAGGTITNAITISNNGTSASTGTVTAHLSPPYTLKSASGTGWTCALKSLTCTTKNAVAAGASLPPITITSAVPAADDSWLGQGADTYLYVSNPGDKNTTDDEADLQTPVQQPPVDLVPLITGPSQPVAAGGTITNTVTVANTGSAASSGTVTIDAYAPVPGGSYSGSGWTCTTQGVCATNTAVPAGGTLPPITITSTAPTTDPSWLGAGQTAEADLTNPSDGDTANNDATIDTPLQQPPVDLVPLITGPSQPVAAGGTITNTVTVANTGSAASSGTVTIDAYAPVPGGSYSGSGWTCTTQGVCATNTAVPAGGTLPPITITSTAPTTDPSWLGAGQTAEADLTNPSDGDTANNDATIDTPLQQPPVDLVPLITGPSQPVAAGGTITNTVTVANTGSAASSGTVTIDAYAPVPGGSYSGSGWTCTTQGVCATNTAVPAGGTLPPITITSTAPTGLTQANQAEADLTNSTDGDTSDNDAYVTTWTTP